MTDLKILNNSDPGTATRAGGNDWDDMAGKVNTYVNDSTSTATYTIYIAGSNKKSFNNATKTVLSTDTSLNVVLQATIDALGNTSGKKIQILNGFYLLPTAAINFTAIDGYCTIEGESPWVQIRPSGDYPVFDINGKTGINLRNIYLTHNQAGYTSNMISLRNGSMSCDLSYVYMYDNDQHVGNGIGFDTTTGNIFRNSFNHLYIYGFNNSVYASVPNSTYFCNSNYFDSCWFWNPIRGLSLNTAASSGFDNNNFRGCQIQAKSAAPNMTVVGFDYETNVAGHAWYTSHHANMVWDLGASQNYANVAAGNLVNLDLYGCTPGYKIGGAGSTAGHIIAMDHFSFNRGKSTQSGNGTTKVFNIAHGLPVAPTSSRVTVGSVDAGGSPAVTFDTTNVILTYAIAPPSGSSNLIWNWEASVF